MLEFNSHFFPVVVWQDKIEIGLGQQDGCGFIIILYISISLVILMKVAFFLDTMNPRVALVLFCLVSVSTALNLQQRFRSFYEDDDSKVRDERKNKNR